MKLGQYGEAEMKDGNLVISATIPVAAAVNAKIDEFTAKVNSGEIDPVKGTDMDKVALLKAAEMFKAYVNGK